MKCNCFNFCTNLHLSLKLPTRFVERQRILKWNLRNCHHATSKVFRIKKNRDVIFCLITDVKNNVELLLFVIMAGWSSTVEMKPCSVNLVSITCAKTLLCCRSVSGKQSPVSVCKGLVILLMPEEVRRNNCSIL